MTNSFLTLLISNVVFAGVLTVAALGITRLWRNPYLAHALWLLVLVKLVTPPIATLPVPLLPNSAVETYVEDVKDVEPLSPMEFDRVPDNKESLYSSSTTPVVTKKVGKTERDELDSGAAVASNIELTKPDTPTAKVDSVLHSSMRWSVAHWWELAFGVWALGTLVLVFVAATRHRRLLHVIAESNPPEAHILHEAEDVARSLGLRKCSPLHLTHAKIGPMVAICQWKLQVLLPLQLLGGFTPEQIRTVLAHEFAHIRRRDYLVRCFELMVLVLYWWNPIAWVASRRLRQAEEECCDALVVSIFPDDRRSYGQALLRTIEFVTECRTPSPVAGTAFGETSFKSRIEQIMNRDFPQRHMIWSCAIAILLGTVILPFSVASSRTDVNGNQPFAKADNTSKPRSPNTANPQTDRKWKTEKFTQIEFPRDEPHKFDGIDQIEFSADGKSLYVAAHRVGNLGFLHRKQTTYWIEHWDVSKWNKLATVKDLAAPIATVGDNKTIIALPAQDAQGGPPYGRIGKFATYDLKKEAITRKFDVNSGYVTGLACSPDGQSIVSCSRADATNPYRWINGHVISWNIDGRQQWGHHWNSGRLSVVDWSSDGSSIFGAGSGGVFAWKTESGATVWEHNDHPNNVESLACSDDGRYVVTGSYCDPSSGFGLLGRLYSEIKIRNAKDGKPIRTVKLYHKGVVRPLDLAVDPEGRSIAVALGSYNRGQKWGEVRIVNIETGETTATLLKNHIQPVTSVAYSSNGQFLVAGTADGFVKLWEIQPDDQIVIEGVLADMLSKILFSDDFLDGLGEAIEQELREKLELKSEMEWKLFESVDVYFSSEIFDEERAVLLVHLMLPSNTSQKSKTIILNTSDDPAPFLKFTRSYEFVSRPTAILTTVELRTGTKQPVLREISLTWNNDQWVKVKRDTIERTIEQLDNQII